MTKDGPHSGRIRFGFKEAKDAGVPYSAGRSTSAINLERLVKARPYLISQVTALSRKGLRADTILNELRERGQAEHYYADFFRGANGDEWFDYKWLFDRDELVARIKRDLELRICSYAELWEFSDDTCEWSIVATFPCNDQSPE